VELELSPDQEVFQDSTRRFLEAECPMTRVRELAEHPDGFERDWWQRGAALGWTALLVPEEQGGGSISGRGLIDLTLVADQFGRHVAPGPLVATNVVAAALAQSGTPEQQVELLPGIVAGEIVATWCDGCTVDRVGDGFVVRGAAAPVEAGAQADWLLVTGDDIQVLVPATASGVQATPLHSLDLVRRFATVRFDDVEVPASAAVARDSVERQLDVALVIQVAEMVGAADRVFAFTLEWAFDRYSFGRPLASYQELKHRFADMKMWLEACHATAAAAANAVEDEAPDAAELASVAKAYVGDFGMELMQDCVQMHGGIGLTYDHDLHVFLRRATQNRALFGSPAWHRQRLAGYLEEAV